MDTQYDDFELVRIASNFRLLDPESYERRYRRADETPLEPGLYVVHWPASASPRRFDEQALYFGPFKLASEARAAMEALRARLTAPQPAHPAATAAPALATA